MPTLSIRPATTMKEERTASSSIRPYGTRRHYAVTVSTPISERAVTLLSQAWAEGAAARYGTEERATEAATAIRQ